MLGTVLGFDADANEGVITGNDGARYKFSHGDWKSPGEPAASRKVDFDPAGDRAIDIYAAPGAFDLGSGDPARSAMTAGAISLGCGFLSYFIGPLAIFTLIASIIFGIKGKKEGAGLPDKTAYYMSVGGLVLSSILLAVIVLTLASCGLFIGTLGMFGWLGDWY